MNEAVTANRKCRKAAKKQRSSTNLDVSKESATSETAAKTNDSEYSVTIDSSSIKRLLAKSDRNSGVVRIIEKSQRKRGQRTDNIEEELQLDVGIGGCQW